MNIKLGWACAALFMSMCGGYGASSYFSPSEQEIQQRVQDAMYRTCIPSGSNAGWRDSEIIITPSKGF